MSAVKPATSEYAPYYERYVSLVPQGDILETLGNQVETTLALLSSIPEEQGDYRYGPDKWSIKELLGHVIDAERIFAYRALRFGRNDSTELEGFEQDDYSKNNKLDGVGLAELVKEFESVRRSTIYLLKHFDDTAWSRRGVASNNEVSVRALAHIIAGHEIHHRNVLRERYL